MKTLRLMTLLCLAALVAGCQTRRTHDSASLPPLKLGVEVLFKERLDLIRGKRVGLITNPTGVDSKLDSIIQLFHDCPETKLVALYGPEHGVRGNAQAGEYVPFYYDEQWKLPVFSLYGQSQKPPPDMLTNIDAYMRTFDTQHSGKQIERGMMQSVDVMVFDLQDVGTRVYTYIATMAYAMQACAEAGHSVHRVGPAQSGERRGDGRADFGIPRAKLFYRAVSHSIAPRHDGRGAGAAFQREVSAEKSQPHGRADGALAARRVV